MRRRSGWLTVCAASSCPLPYSFLAVEQEKGQPEVQPNLWAWTEGQCHGLGPAGGWKDKGVRIATYGHT